MLLSRVPIFAATLLLAASLLPAIAPHAQSADPVALPRTTPEHLRAAAWWPTKPLASRQEFVGNAVCARCHAEIAASQGQSQMARTLGPAAHSTVLAQHLHASFHSGPYTTTLAHSPAGYTLHVSDGEASEQAVLQWAFGSGDVGQSYLWQSADGVFHESRFNFFRASDAFADTPGRLQGVPTSLAMAVSRRIEPFEAQTCFRCHTTTMAATLPLDTHTVAPGIGCEACHGPGAQHVANARAAARVSDTAGASHAAWDRATLNPEDLSPTDAVDLCGSCHATAADVQQMGAVGLQTIRFPAYRLEGSRCWLASAPNGAGDDRLTCQSCHNPHAPLDRAAEHYDSVCMSCHGTRAHAQTAALAPAASHPGRACPVAISRCTSCHMPKLPLAEMHSSFTDHRIRIARADVPFPDAPAN